MDATTVGAGCHTLAHRAPSPALGGPWNSRTTRRQGKKESFLGVRESVILTRPSREQAGAPSAAQPRSPGTMVTRGEVRVQ